MQAGAKSVEIKFLVGVDFETGLIAQGCSGNTHILKGAAHSQHHHAPLGIGRAQVPGPVCRQIDPIRLKMEAPWLGVMGAGSQHATHDHVLQIREISFFFLSPVVISGMLIIGFRLSFEAIAAPSPQCQPSQCQAGIF